MSCGCDNCSLQLLMGIAFSCHVPRSILPLVMGIWSLPSVEPFPGCVDFVLHLILCIQKVVFEGFVSPFWSCGSVVCGVASLGFMVNLQHPCRTTKLWEKKMLGCFIFFSRPIQPSFCAIDWYLGKLIGRLCSIRGWMEFLSDDPHAKLPLDSTSGNTMASIVAMNKPRFESYLEDIKLIDSNMAVDEVDSCQPHAMLGLVLGNAPKELSISMRYVAHTFLTVCGMLGLGAYSCVLVWRSPLCRHTFSRRPYETRAEPGQKKRKVGDSTYEGAQVCHY